eukprot:8503679-Pyramimonas_sp.AAC.1
MGSLSAHRWRHARPASEVARASSNDWQGSVSILVDSQWPLQPGLEPRPPQEPQSQPPADPPSMEGAPDQ